MIWCLSQKLKKVFLVHMFPHSNLAISYSIPILSPSGWWYTYPSEKWWSSSVGIMKFPTEWKVIKCSKPPTSHNDWFYMCQPLLSTIFLPTGIPGIWHPRHLTGEASGTLHWLVVEPYPSEKYESVGIMTFPTEWKNKIHVANHQPDSHISGVFLVCTQVNHKITGGKPLKKNSILYIVEKNNFGIFRVISLWWNITFCLKLLNHR